MKNQTLFSSKDKKKLKCRLLQFLFGTLGVKHVYSLLLISHKVYPKPLISQSKFSGPRKFVLIYQ